MAGVLITAASLPARAAGPQGELGVLMAQLRENVSDQKRLAGQGHGDQEGSLEATEDSIRKRIIDLVHGARMNLPVPDEVNTLIGRATYEFKNAKQPVDFYAPYGDFWQASVLAPWLPDLYFNMGLAMEKTNDYAEAIRWLNLYLVAAPNAPDRAQVVQRLGGLQYAKEHAGAIFAGRWLDSVRDKFFGLYAIWTCNSCTWNSFLGRGQAAQLQPLNAGRFTITVAQDELVISPVNATSPWFEGKPDCSEAGSCVVKWHDLRSGVESIGDINKSAGICEGRPFAALWFSVGVDPMAPQPHDYWAFLNTCQ